MPLRNLVLVLLLFLFVDSYGQITSSSVSLRTGEVKLQPVSGDFNKTMLLLQFQTLPGNEAVKIMVDKGIVLLDYAGNRTYIASLTKTLKAEVLKQSGVIAFHPWLPQHKLHPLLAKASGTVDVMVHIPTVFSIADAVSSLSARNFIITDRNWEKFGQLILRVSADQLQELASFPFIQYIEPAPPDPQSLNNRSRQLTHATVLNTSIAEGGKGLNGEGVTIGIGDDGNPIVHVDFTGRVISRRVLGVNHGVHVSGTAAGAGIVNEIYRGFASKARLVVDNQSAIVSTTSTYAQDYDMVVTNNSYAGGLGCENNNGYNGNSRTADLLAFSHPAVLHVFAAGNSGTLNCSPYPVGFNTLSGGFQCAKNVLTVGAVNDTGLYADFSSRGPVTDGRLKPEIMAHGNGIVSTQIGNSYNTGWGTSFASPAVTGGAALLYQRYRQLYNNNNPANALIKALLCNGADDIGNPGPDFSNGFGVMNLLRSIDMLEQQHYFTATISNAANNTHSIAVPANTAQLKVMLYWNDAASLPIIGNLLINDLDLELTTPANNIVLPLTLDTIPANVNNPATNKADHVNNIEQIVIDQPAAGNYTVRVKGTSIAQGLPQYFLVYDIVPVSLNLTYPSGAETLLPGEITRIRWDAYGNAANGFTIEYSADNGNSWTNIATNVSPTSRNYTWSVPSQVTADARIRITQNGTGLSSLSQRFTIIDAPVVTLDPVQCEGSIVMHWNAVPGATNYEVMMLRGTEMQSVGTTNNTDWYFTGLDNDSVYWLSVRGQINGRNGRRAIAVSRQPNNGNCSLPYFDNDLKLDSILSPVTGRKFTSTALSAVAQVKVQIKNLDNVPANGFIIEYAVNNGAWISETINTSIPPLGIYIHTFSQTADLSALGSYTITAVVKNLIADPIPLNDTLRVTVRQIDNQPLLLNTTNSFFDDLEVSPDTIYTTPIKGLANLDRYDFEKLPTTGQLRTFANTGVAYSGRNSFIMGELIDRFLADRGMNIAIGTFNLAGKSVNANDIRLNFRYLVTIGGTNNDVWIRGSDVDPWIRILDFNPNLSPIGSTQYRELGQMEIADSLMKHGQNFSSSFQVRWRESHYLPKISGRMYSIDDIGLIEVNNDLQMVSIDNPVSGFTCGLGTAPVTVTIFNSHNSALTNIPVQYSVNNGAWVTEIIPSIAANTRIQYTFTQGADLNTPGLYSIKTAIAYAGDTYRLNDTSNVTLRAMPLITSYPHVQDFESGNGGWYAEGTNSSWEFGTPSSTSINRAASGSKAWKTKLNGNYNHEETSYLYSPCYQLTGMAKPMLSFSMAVQLNGCGNICDRAGVDYSTNGGVTWTRITSAPGIINWYNNALYWGSLDQTRWHVVTTSLPAVNGNIRFRFAMNSDVTTSGEGVAIDDIHLYDSVKAIYDGATMTVADTKQLSGNQWINFESNDKLIASIHPGTQNLGNTEVQAYINTTAVRHAGSQYYHDRNITIKPSVNPQDSVTVRFYYLDSETNDLLNASGCQLCTNPADAYRLGISRYSNANRSIENGTIDDNNLSGSWRFIHPSSVKHVPFDRGYYAEFKVKSFSEIWLNDGGLDTNSVVITPVFNFTAQRAQGTDVLLKWITGDETKVTKYEIEVARGIQDFQNNLFTKLGELQARHAATIQSYDFTDNEADKFGQRYYRLKIIYNDNSFSYSEVRLISFDEAVIGKVYPNPSTGKFNLILRLPAGNPIKLRVINTTGQTIRTYNLVATGYPQTLPIDLTGAAAGMYLLQLENSGQMQHFKLINTR